MRFALFAASCSVLALTGCASLPRSGPSSAEVVEHSTSESTVRYEIIQLDNTVAGILARRPIDSLQGHFGDRRGSPEAVIGIGDSVSVVIYEAAGGGLFSSPVIDKNSAGSHTASLPEQVVTRDGAISVPYAGRIHVAGRTARSVEQSIVNGLKGKAVEPQAIVSISRSVSNSVTVVGEVNNGNRVPLTQAGDRLLDVIAVAGGVKSPINETYVRLSRGGSTVSVPLQRVVANPAENIFVRPRDVVTLVRQPQTFTILGATEHNGVATFEADGVTLTEGLAKAGGLNDLRASAQGVFVFRFEPPSIVRAINPASAFLQGAQRIPVVYRLDLTDPNSFFVAKSFALRDKDVVYVSNAPSVEWTKFLALIQSFTGPAASVSIVKNQLKL